MSRLRITGLFFVLLPLLPAARIWAPAAVAAPADCNTNMVADFIDIEDGGSADCNTNGKPDECDVGQYGRALSFDGGQYVQATLNVSETSYTVSLWFRTTNAFTGLFSVDDGALGGGGHDRHIYLLDGDLCARVWTNEVICTSGINFADGNWHQVVHVFGGSIGGQKIFVDGMERASGSKSSSNFTWQSGINIGFSNDSVGGFFDGAIDEVRIWNVALTAQEISTNFQFPQFIQQSANLQAGYSFGEANGDQSVLDSAALDGNNNGVLGASVAAGSDDPMRMQSDLLAGSVDCNNDKTPDECESSADSDGDGVRDACDQCPGFNDALDCDQDGTPDGCEPDCNANGTPDECESDGPLEGYALGFAGSADYARVQDFGAVAPTTEVTVEFWQNVDGLRAQATFTALPDEAENRFNAHVPWDNGRVYWDFGGECCPAGRLEYLPPEPITGTWQHFAFVASQSGNFMRIYRNGMMEAQKMSMTPREPADLDLLIGNNFAGRIDEFRVWNVARTESEIQAAMNTTLIGDEPGLVAYWRFDEGAGASAQDLAGGLETTVASAQWAKIDQAYRDCDGDRVPDVCQPDCDTNGVVDVCDAADAAVDCDANGVPDACDVAAGAPDCNHNARPDACDLSVDLSLTAAMPPDLNGDCGYDPVYADLDGDKDLDIAFLDNYCDEPFVAVRLHNADGTFADGGNFGGGANLFDLTARDLDNDGDIDLFLFDYLGKSVTVLLNNGDATFGDATYETAPCDPHALLNGDLNNDGKIDLAALDTCSDSVFVRLNLGDGTYPESADVYDLDGTCSERLTLADLNNDGFLDLLVETYCVDGPSPSSGSLRLNVLLNNGDGTFGGAVGYDAPDLYCFDELAIADLDLDGYPDVAAVNFCDQHLSVLRNNGNGSLSEEMTYPLGDCVYRYALTDLNGDGLLDVAAAQQCESTLAVRVNNGDATFGDLKPYGDTPICDEGPILASDLDGDGDNDVAIIDECDDLLFVLLNAGDASFPDESTYDAETCAPRLIANDLNADGKPELITGGCDGSVVVFEGIGDGKFRSVNVPTFGLQCDDPQPSLSVLDLDADGRPDIVHEFYCSNEYTIGLLLNRSATMSVDCDGNSTPDECDLAALDCNQNGLVDACEADADGDLVPDDCDLCPGVADGPDSDADGTPDGCDDCPADANKVEPGVCGCGTPDADADGDSVLDCNDGCPDDADKQSAGECGCGESDRDSDGDGTADCHDGCPDDPNKLDPGACGCGESDRDSDGDGTADCRDGCPDDPNKIDPGACGCGVPDTDLNANGAPDCLEVGPGPAETPMLELTGTSCGICGAGFGSATGLTTLLTMVYLVTARTRKRRCRRARPAPLRRTNG